MLWRRLLPAEQAFVLQHFGAQQGDWLAQQVRLGLRRVGDSRRALCLNGGWLSFPRACYGGASLQAPLRLDHPAVAGLFAHELLHQLQRSQGLPVTRQAVALHARQLLPGWLGGRDPYAYRAGHSARARLRQFWQAQVEQQAQMWQDHVQALVAGRPDPAWAGVARAVQAGRLRRR